MSLIAPRDVQCTLRFAVGQRFCVATLQFAKDEDASEIVRKFLAEENIPAYLHDSIQSTIRSMIWEEINSTIRESENILDGALMIESARLLARQYDATVKKRRGSETIDAKDRLAVDQFMSKEEKIASAYSTLVSSLDWMTTLTQLELSYAMAINQLIENREIALTNLRERQSQEMDHFSQQSPDAVASVVNRHVTEIEKMEKKWEAEVKEAKARQKTEYRNFILDSYKAYITDPNFGNGGSGPRVEEPAQVSTKSKSNATQNGSTKSDRSSWAPWSAFFGGDEEKEKSPAPKTNSASTINAPFGRDGQPVPTGLNSAKAKGPSSANSSRLQKQENNANGTENVVSVVAMLGGIQKTPYEIQVTCAPNAFSFAATAASKSGATRSNPFGTNLSAVVLITDTNISLHSTSYSEFIKLCDKSTEFLFDDIQTQLDRVKKEISETSSTAQGADTDSPSLEDTRSSNNQPQPLLLKTGDFFVTTHSNLNIDVVFHMALEKKNNAATTSKMLSGLRNILALAAQYDITMLTLPALLLEPDFKHLFSEAQISKRAEQIVREIRAFLVENSHGDNSLRTIRLVLNSGPSSADLYRDLVKIVHNTFNQSA